MLYTKIRMDFKYAEKGRFYRVVLIKGNPDLLKLGIAFGEAVGCEFEHCFLITCKGQKLSYVMAPFMEDPMDGYCLVGKHFLDELPEEFDFEYDTGDGWDFHCKRYKKQVEFDSEQDVIVLEGAGQGIWEDNIGTLCAYLEGKIKGDAKENPSKGIYKPWNVEIKHFSDFDLPLDLDSLNKKIAKLYPKDCKHIAKGEQDYIKQNNVNIEDHRSIKTIPNDKFFNSMVYEDVTDMIAKNDSVRKDYQSLLGLYDEGKALNIVTSVYFKQGILSHLTGKKFDMGRFLKDLEETIEYLRKPTKK